MPGPFRFRIGGLAPATGGGMASQQDSKDALKFPDILSVDEVDRRVPASDIKQTTLDPKADDRERALVAAERLHAAFPRIHDQIRALWGTAACEDYLDKLVFDERGDRAGFPPPVLEAILILQRIHFKQFGSFRPATPWDVSAQN